MPFNVGGVTSGFLKFGGEFRYNLRTNEQGTPYAGIRGGSQISNQLIQLVGQRYSLPFYSPFYDSVRASFTAVNFTAGDPDLTRDFLGDRFGGVLWANGRNLLNGITEFLSHEPSINAVNSSGTNAGGWFDGLYQHLPNKYKYIEKYYAGYLMTELNFGQTLKVVGGARWEEIKALYDAYNLADGRNPNTQIVDSVFSHPWNRYWLPMVQAKWNLFEWVDLRYSFTKTLARPDYHQLSPRFSMNVLHTEVWAGNPRLKPAESFNHDVFVTFHGNELGLLSVGAFYKEVKNFTFSTRYPLHAYSPFGLDSLSMYRVRVSAAGGFNYVNPNDGARLNTYTNSSSPAYVRGLEVDFQTRLWYLPEPFNGTVLGVNYTHVNSKAVYPFRDDSTIVIPAVPRPITRVVTFDSTRDGRLVNQPNDIVNAYIGYDRGDFSGRISFLFQGNSTNSIGKFSELDGYTKDYFRIDLAVRQKLPWFGLQVFLDVFNLNARKNEAAQTSIDGFTSIQHYGMTANLGLRFIM
jgi:TonB-dependent receptor